MRHVERKNGKASEGLSLKGIANHIGSALRCFQEYKGTANDCQLTINPLIRVYHREFIKVHNIRVPTTPGARIAMEAGEPRGESLVNGTSLALVLEHAVPAHEVVRRLMEIDPAEGDFDSNILTILENTLYVAWVLKEEHDKLNKKHMHNLPMFAGATLQQLVEARYHLSGVPIPTFL